VKYSGIHNIVCSRLKFQVFFAIPTPLPDVGTRDGRGGPFATLKAERLLCSMLNRVMKTARTLFSAANTY